MARRTYSRKLATLAAICAVAAMPATASAGESCGGRQAVKHTTSWATHETTFYAKGCMLQLDNNATVVGVAEFTSNGWAGFNNYPVIVITDTTDGRQVSNQGFTSAPEQKYINEDRSSGAVQRSVTVWTPKMTTIKGHRYSMHAYNRPDVINDGKGRFEDSHSYATWVK